MTLLPATAQNAVVHYQTGFELADTGPGKLGEFDGWIVSSAGSSGIHGGAWNGSGKAAYVGKERTSVGANVVAYRWVGDMQPTTNRPMVLLELDMALFDSTNSFYEEFSIDLRNRDDQVLASLYFNNQNLGIYGYTFDTNSWNYSGHNFANGTKYRVSLELDFKANTWSAKVGDALVVANRPLGGGSDRPLEMGLISLFWYQDRPTVAETGNNFLVADNILLTSDSGPYPFIQTQPQSPPVAFQQVVTLSVQATGEMLSYQWYRGRKSGAAQLIEGATDADWTSPALTEEAWYWVRVRSATHGYVDSEEVKISVLPRVISGLSAIMDDGGSASSLREYVLGAEQAQSADFGETRVIVGETTGYNRLTIRNGSLLVGRGPEIGYGTNAPAGNVSALGNNAIVVDGVGSAIQRAAADLDGSGAGQLRVGYRTGGNRLWVKNQGAVKVQALVVGESGSGNHALFESGATFETTGPYIGADAIYVGNYASDNTLVVRGAGTRFRAIGNNDRVSVGSSFSASWKNNSLQIAGGAFFEATTLTVGYSSSRNSVQVAGPGSELRLKNRLVVGISGGADGNQVVVEDSGLVVINTPFSTPFSYGLALNEKAASGNFLRLKGGFLAWKGDHRSHLSPLLGAIEVWNGSSYESAPVSSHFAMQYFASEADAKAFTAANTFTGYSGLAGYTILGNRAPLPPNSFDLWVQDQGLVGANATPTAAPFADGLSNLVRYAMNLGETTTPAQWPEVSVQHVAGVPVLVMEYRLRKNRQDISVEIQSSEDLTTWTAVPAVQIVRLEDDDVETERHAASVPFGGSGRVFLRMKVVEGP
ncbi:hypothetical protein [Oleiharenicola lentus]|uniref:hypothetical protein n=1 Tax=Oleiharenicola lentus TaxID=2508720 RepID=UPI003F675906